MSSSVTIRLKQMWRKSQTIGHDSIVLISKLIRSPSDHHSTSSASSSSSSSSLLSPHRRDILIREARESQNTVAISWLRMEQELALVHYHGIVGYLARHTTTTTTTTTFLQTRLAHFWPPKLPSMRSNETTLATDSATATITNDSQPSTASSYHYTSASTPSTTTSTIRSSSTQARVPFMITAAQRKTLYHDLEYANEHIQHLNPMQASWILQNNHPPPFTISETDIMDFKTKLDALMQGSDTNSNNGSTTSPMNSNSKTIPETTETTTTLSMEPESSMTTETSIQLIEPFQSETDHPGDKDTVQPFELALMTVESTTVSAKDATTSLEASTSSTLPPRRSIPSTWNGENSSTTTIHQDATTASSSGAGATKDDTANSTGRLWYQVVAIMPADNYGTKNRMSNNDNNNHKHDNADASETTRMMAMMEESVGLFPNEAEANLCQETKALLAAKHTPGKDIRYEVRRTRR